MLLASHSEKVSCIDFCLGVPPLRQKSLGLIGHFGAKKKSFWIPAWWSDTIRWNDLLLSVRSALSYLNDPVAVLANLSNIIELFRSKSGVVP